MTANTSTGPILSQRALLLGKIETTYNVDAGPVPTTDAFLVMNADAKISPNVLKRDFYRPSLSPLPTAVGRKLATLSFTHEVKGSGLSGVAPKLATLLKGCGFAMTTIANTAAAVINNIFANPQNSGPAITWTKTTPPTKNYGRYKIRVVLGGVSATAKIRVTGNPTDTNDTTILPSEDFSTIIMQNGSVVPTTVVAVDQSDPLAVLYTVATPQIGDIVVLSIGGIRLKYVIASAVAATEATAIAAAVTALADARFSAAAATGVVTITITAGVIAVTTGTTAIVLGSSAASANMAWTGSLALNDTWTIELLRPGFHLTPISTGFQSLTMYMYYDGTVHRLTGCIGNVAFTATAGAYATAAFTFTGQYHNPDDQALPLNAVFEPSNPVQVELAQLTIGSAMNLAAQSFNVDMGIVVNPRDSVSDPDGYKGVLYSSRDPKGGCNPEMEYESVEPYWRHLAAADILRFHARVGSLPNNIVEFQSNTIQLSNIAYAARNTQRIYDLSMGFVEDQFTGDDEIRIVFS
jgi:hypothetical protein